MISWGLSGGGALSVVRRMTLELPPASRPLRHTVDESDIHTVPSPDVATSPPIDPLGVIDTSPNPQPCTVNDTDDVDAPFAPATQLVPSTSADIVSDTVPPSQAPTVTASPRLAPGPDAVSPRSHVSDAHPVISNPV